VAENIASMSWHLFIYCPHCDELIDLVDLDSDGCYSIPIFNNNWDKIKGMEETCPQCGKEFVINGVEY